MPSPRIVSFLPAATEMVYALGLGDHLAGVSHECDFPVDARTKPVVVRPARALASLAPREIDAAIVDQLRARSSLYAVDEVLLRTLAPDLILTQDLCQVCAPSGNDVTRALASLLRPPDVLYFTPRTLGDVWANVHALGDATNTRERANAVVASAERRLARVRESVASIARRPTVFFAEWVDPIYRAGHWVPEMIELAGGQSLLARPGEHSVRIEWSEVVDAQPEVIIVGPCGYSLADAMPQVQLLADRPGWNELPAVRGNRVFVVDASAYFARPGPRLVEGVELLADLLHGTASESSAAVARIS